MTVDGDCDGCGDCSKCDAWQRRLDIAEAESTATMAETCLDYLWEAGPDGLLRRKAI